MQCKNNLKKDVFIQRREKTLNFKDLTASKNYEPPHFIPKYAGIPADSLKLFQLLEHYHLHSI